MAQSPSHRFGQVVGNLLEEILLPQLLQFCNERDLYLDRHGNRTNVRKGKKVTWEDSFGNFHDLDFVIEKGGSENDRGRPVAFIEAAWRRYTKHSRAKAQEIQGAVLPIAEKYRLESPFLGAILAGIFTTPSINQLKSLGFHVVYLPYESIMTAFESVGIDARFDETTPDDEFRICVDLIESLPADDRHQIKESILESNSNAFESFYAKLRRKLDRTIRRVAILPLFGNSITFENVSDAMKFIKEFDRKGGVGEFHKYELSVLFSNGDEVRGIFSDEEEVVHFLNYVTS